MSRTSKLPAKSRLALAAAVLTLLSACGGGGGDTPAPTLIDVTLANRDTVAHATAGSLLALGVSTEVPIFGGASGASAVRVPTLFGAAWAAAYGATRERPLAVITPPPQNCAIAGTTSVSLNDSNNNGSWDIGEAATVVFNQCQDSAGSVLNGSSVLTITGGSTTSFTATMSMTQLVQQATNGRHSMTINGNLTLACSQLGPTSARCTSTANGTVSAALHTHQFDDTVTLQNGFVEESTRDDSLGHSQTTLRGTIHSAAAGGKVSVSTETAIGALDADAYPHEGAVRVSGERGVMRITALSATQVRIDLDAATDGTFESTLTDTWDWLL